MATEVISARFRLDTVESAKSLRQFSTEWTALLKELGKTPTEIRAFNALAKDVQAGKVAIESLDAETRKLVETYQQFRTLAGARQQLNLIPQQQIAAEVEKLRAAYDTLRTSGKLSAQELAQAQLKLRERTAELERGTIGWADALGRAKGELAAVAAAGGGLALATNAAIDFETALYKVAKTVDATPEQLAALSAQFRELSTQLPLSASALAEIAAAGGQLGVAAPDIRQFTELVAKLATAFDIAPAAAAKSVATLKTVFGLGLTEIERLGDAVNVLGNNTAAREADIVEVLARIGGASKVFGLAADQAAALGAAFLALGKQPEVAATAINALLSKLQTANIAGDDFRSGLARIGVSSEALAANIKANPQQAVLDLLRSLQKLDAQSRAETLTRLFGLEYQDDISLLVGSLGEYEKALGLVGDRTRVTGSLQQELDKRLKTTQAQLDILKNAVNDAAINLGSIFLPAVNGVVQVLGQGAAAIASFIEQFPALTSAAALLVTAATAAKGLELALLAVTAAGARLPTVAAAVALLRTEITLTTLAANKFSTAFAAIASFEIGWNIGEKLRDEYAGVRKFGVAIVGGLLELAEGVRYGWELAKASFTDDTWDAASERHRQRLGTLRDEFTQLFIDAEQGPKKAGAASDQAAAAAARLGAAAATAGAQAAAAGKAGAEAYERLPKAVQEAVDKLGQAKRQSEALGPVFAALLNEGLFSGAGAAGVQRVADALDLMRQRSMVTNTEIQNGLSTTLAQLSGNDLLRFQQEAQRAFSGTQGDSARLAQFLEGTLSAALTRLGVDAASVGVGFSQASTEAVTAFRTVLANGTASADAVRAAFAGALSKVTTQSDADALAGLFRTWAKAAGLSADEIERALLRVRGRIQSIKDATDPVAQAFADLGLQSRASLDQVAERSRQAFLTIKNSGTASAGDVRAAFLKYADAALAAARAAGDGSEQTVQAQLASQAAVLGVTAEYLRLTGQTNAAADATERLLKLQQRQQQGGGGKPPVQQETEDTTKAVVAATNAFADFTAEILSYGVEAARLFDSNLHAQGLRDLSTGLGGVAAQAAQSTDTIEGMRAALERLRAATHAGGANETDSNLAAWGRAANATRIALLEATLAAAEAEQALKSAGASAADLARAESVLRENAHLLGSERLQPLRDAIEQIRQQAKGLDDDITSTVAGLRSELAQLEGDNRRVEALRYQRQRAELQAKADQAAKLGDEAAAARAREALSLAAQIHKKKLAIEESEQRAARANAAETARQPQTVAAAPSSPAAAPASSSAALRIELVVTDGRVRVPMTSGQSVHVASVDEAVDQVISAIESATRYSHATRFGR